MKDLKIICLVGILAMIFVGCLLYPNKSNIVQAEAVVALVFVTLVYAIETHKLVREGQIKRIADFMERRISEFYFPCFEGLRDLMNIFILLYSDDLHIRNNTEKLRIPFRDLRNLLNSKAYMASRDTSKEIKEWVFANYRQDFAQLAEQNKEDLKTFENKTNAFIEKLKKEKTELEKRIREIYAYSEDEL